MNPSTPLRRNRRFLSLFAADTVSAFGDRIHALALYVLVLDRTGRALDVGALALAQLLPATLLAPLSGWLIDRVDRRRMMIYMDVLRCGLVLLLPFVTHMREILLIAAVLSAARQFHEPARLAVLPSIVAPGQIVTANSLSVGTMQLLLLIGPAVGGVLIATLGISAAFQIDAATYVASALLLLGVGRLPSIAAAKLRHGASAWRQFVSETREGVQLVLDDRVLRFAIGFFAVTVLVTSMQQPLLLLFVKHLLGGSDVELGLVMSAAGLGGLVGSALAPLSRRIGAPLRLIPGLCVLDGLALIAFALTRSIPPALALVAVFGLVAGLLEIHVVSLFQERVPEAARGRAFGWLGPIFGPLSLASIGVGTALAQSLGVMPILLGSGVLEAALALAALALVSGATQVREPAASSSS